MSRIDKRLLDASERKIMGQGERYQGFSRNMLQFIMPKISTLANHFWKFYSGENLWKFSFYFWKLGPLPRLFSFLELVLFGWTRFKVETHKKMARPRSNLLPFYVTFNRPNRNSTPLAYLMPLKMVPPSYTLHCIHFVNGLRTMKSHERDYITHYQGR